MHGRAIGDRSRLTWQGNGGDEGEDEKAGQHDEHEERLPGVAVHSACSRASRDAGVSHSCELTMKVAGILKLQWEWDDAGVVPVLPRVL
jgi:hypothetical protein